MDSQNAFHLRFSYSPIDAGGVDPQNLAAGTPYVKVYASVDPAGPQLFNSNGYPLPNTWEMTPDNVVSPVTLTDPGPWSVLIQFPKRGNPFVAGYQKTPFKITVKRLQ